MFSSMFDELKEVKYFKEIAGLKKQNLWRVFKKQRHI